MGFFDYLSAVMTLAPIVCIGFGFVLMIYFALTEKDEGDNRYRD